jgi:hypothetical protein
MTQYRYIWTRSFTIDVYVHDDTLPPSQWSFRGVLRNPNGRFIAVRHNKDYDKLVKTLEDLFYVSQQ